MGFKRLFFSRADSRVRLTLTEGESPGVDTGGDGCCVVPAVDIGGDGCWTIPGVDSMLPAVDRAGPTGWLNGSWKYVVGVTGSENGPGENMGSYESQAAVEGRSSGGDGDKGVIIVLGFLVRMSGVMIPGVLDVKASCHSGCGLGIV